MASTALRTRRWTRREYERLIELGVFAPGERLELIDGVLLVKEPQGALHFSAIRLLQDTLSRVLGDSWEIRAQGPIALDARSEPEPDIAVVQGTFRDYVLEHPARASLVIEVSDATLAIDRRKGGVYARAGVPDFWIVNLVDRRLEIYRSPARSPQSRFGWTYSDVRHVGRSELVTPLILPAARIPVSDLVP
jgi:Uma2 family endonuclease